MHGKLPGIFLWCFLITASSQVVLNPIHKTNISVHIRRADINDFDDIKALWIKSFAHAYNLTSQEQIDGLQERIQPYCETEIVILSENQNDKIPLIALHNDKIIGYLSINFTENPDEIYGRFLAVDQDFQGQNVMSKLLEHCYRIVPTIKRMVCVTRNINLSAQKLYEYFGGKKVENPSWIRFLPTYPAINSSEWVGYFFDEEAIQAFHNRYNK